jgi:hypothetical protein
MRKATTIGVVLAAALPLGTVLVALGGLLWSRIGRGHDDPTDPYTDWLSLRPRRGTPYSSSEWTRSGNGPVRTPEGFPL